MTSWQFFVLILLTPLAHAQPPASDAALREYYQRRDAEATALYGQKQYAQAAAIHEELRANPALTRMDDAIAHVLYNLACEYSLAGEKQKAVNTLRDAIAGGTVSAQTIRQDSDFDPIRNDPGYQRLLADLDATERPARLLFNSPALRTPYREDLPEDEKIAGLSRIWSEAKFNFVYFFRLDGIDWDGLYLSYLPKVRATRSTMEYYQLLAEFTARLKDGHTGVSYPRQLGQKLGWPLINTALVEGRVFIANVRDPSLAADGIARGVEITAVNGVPVKQYGAERVAPYRGASTPQSLDIGVFESSLLGGPLDQNVELTLTDADGKTYARSLRRTTGAEADKFPHEPFRAFEYKLLPGDIAYVALRSFGDDTCSKQFATQFAEIRKSSAIIFDVRENGGGSSSVGWDILGYLTDKSFLSTQWRTREYRPAERAWGQMERWYGDSGHPLPSHTANPYRGPVVVLTSPRTFSAAEDFAAVFDAMKRGTIVGERTGGSTGQPLIVPLPGGGSVRICTKHDRYPDGKEFVGVGIQPGVAAAPTVDAFRAGRDTVLEVALKLLQE
ncbi:S41 family peptidase [uncultured Paludibaculum sp.]|uniref:S41 family peptidase n=1 Tax=uncultured Paludibaculum sp. TaxID=1765020 RepID=UPI002AABFF89|nr:S41 family peptidase [uncultured Paludibaculum sp.]